jgi:uncharacterized protein DUF4386
MPSTQATARFAGIVYLLFSLLAMFGYFYVPGRFVVAGNAAETARRITEDALLYRLGILASLLGHMLFIVLALSLYKLFHDVDRVQARWLVALVCVGVAGELVSLAYRMAPLVLLSGADFLSTFSKPQLETLSLGFLRLGGTTSVILTLVWGLWLFPFGILTIKSGWFPKFLGYLLYASGVGYVITCVAEILFPDGFRRISPFVTPLAIGELVMVLWLAIIGARVRPIEGRTGDAVGGTG